jgi:transposase InsO family protein
MTGARGAFSELDAGVCSTVRFGDRSVVCIEGCGTVILSNRSGEHHAFTGVYFIPKLKTNILSVGQLDEIGFQVLIDSGVLSIKDTERRLVAKIPRASNWLYVLHANLARPVCYLARAEKDSWRWHACLGHLDFQALKKMANEQWVHGLLKIQQVDQLCDGCLAGKHRRTPFLEQAQYISKEALELVHGDLCGLIASETPSGKKYFLLLVDDYIRYMWIALLPSKDCAAEAIKRIQAEAEASSRKKMRCLRTDRGGEFISADFDQHCLESRVRRQLTAPYSPQQNGVVEWRNQTVVATARCLMKSKGLPAYFWGEAVTTTVYLLNRSPTRSVEGRTPYEAWHGHKPSVEHLRTFGSIVHVKNTKPNLKKLDDRSTKMVFVGYEKGTKAYRAYDPRTGRVHVTWDAVFDELAQWDWSREDGDHGDVVPFEFVVTMTQEYRQEDVKQETLQAGEHRHRHQLRCRFSMLHHLLLNRTSTSTTIKKHR